MEGWEWRAGWMVDCAVTTEEEKKPCYSAGTEKWASCLRPLLGSKFRNKLFFLSAKPTPHSHCPMQPKAPPESTSQMLATVKTTSGASWVPKAQTWSWESGSAAGLLVKFPERFLMQPRLEGGDGPASRLEESLVLAQKSRSEPITDLLKRTGMCVFCFCD